MREVTRERVIRNAETEKQIHVGEKHAGMKGYKMGEEENREGRKRQQGKHKHKAKNERRKQEYKDQEGEEAETGSTRKKGKILLRAESREVKEGGWKGESRKQRRQRWTKNE